MKPEKIKGVLSPVVTPFAKDLSPDGKRFVAHCKWLLEQGCAGLAVFGTTSEANSLSVDERIDLLDMLLAAGIPPGRLMPGTGCCSLTDTVRLTRHATQAGCAGVLMLPPFYYKGVTDEGIFRSFAETIERVGDENLQVYLYHIPPQSQVPLSLPLIERLKKTYPSAIAGIKDSSGDVANLRAVLSAFAGADFDVFPGSEMLLLEGMQHGGSGCITATGNVNPGPIVAVYQNWRSPQAVAMQAGLDTLRKTMQAYPLIAAIKATIAHYAHDEGWNHLRPPLVELDAGQRTELQAKLQALSFAMPGIV